ncbi:MAG: hypothetical protein EBU90_22970 [Proteobacteria bacterium]|nr:hypothetical protein [Pseudomonadota bacterium]
MHYGQLTSEKLAKENEDCRRIVKEILNVGMSQRQHMFLIYLLSLELENIEYVQALAELIKEIAGDQIFISKREDNGTIS